MVKDWLSTTTDDGAIWRERLRLRHTPAAPPLPHPWLAHPDPSGTVRLHPPSISDPPWSCARYATGGSRLRSSTSTSMPAAKRICFPRPRPRPIRALSPLSSSSSPDAFPSQSTPQETHLQSQPPAAQNGTKRKAESETLAANEAAAPKRAKMSNVQRAAPLAERMRPQTLDHVCGQDLVGPNGVIRGLIDQNRVPSMILWSAPGTGKTTIARIVANMVGARFVEINSSSSGVAECKKIFHDAAHDLALTGRRTILFCDEIHRFSKAQQDVFLAPVESGQVTLIAATTENPSFRLASPLLSRCRTFTLAKLTEADILTIMNRAIASECDTRPALLNDDLLHYLAGFADGDARTSLNLLEIAIDLSQRTGMTEEGIKRSLTQTMVYDRAGDQHYDTISALHKSIRGSDPDATLYYLARMIQSGEKTRCTLLGD